MARENWFGLLYNDGWWVMNDHSRR